MAAISITRSPASVIIQIDRTSVSPKRLEDAIAGFEAVLGNNSEEHDPFALEPVSDEEQAEIEAMLRSIPPEDREIAYTEHFTFTSAGEIMRLPREERTIIMAEQAELMCRHYAENPDEILLDALDDIFEETP
jgi:hypothetical protein